jgi:hypothetical protein
MITKYSINTIGCDMRDIYLSLCTHAVFHRLFYAAILLVFWKSLTFFICKHDDCGWQTPAGV